MNNITNCPICGDKLHYIDKTINASYTLSMHFKSLQVCTKLVELPTNQKYYEFSCDINGFNAIINDKIFKLTHGVLDEYSVNNGYWTFKEINIPISNNLIKNINKIKVYSVFY